jgi:hypothetical protein
MVQITKVSPFTGKRHTMSFKMDKGVHEQSNV